MRAPFRIGLLGLGNVGGALARRLVDDADTVARAAGRPLVLEAIAVREASRRQAPAAVTSSETLLGRRDLDAIVEVIGGLEPAHTYINTALEAGRQVVTANKQVIAAHGPDLARKGPIRFEAAVGSGIPIIETLAETLAADRISSVTGILNGTTNSMLQAMGEGSSYEAALADAQRRGMAEADPSADVDGHDAAAKLAILAMLAFRLRMDLSRIERVGIRQLTASSIRDATARGCSIKLIASARRQRPGASVEADVRPRLVPDDDLFARINGALNGVLVEAELAGSLSFIGPGAGPDAAASGVLADLIRAARDIPASAGALLATLAGAPAANVRAIETNHPYSRAE
jgi:homoserine dehydrogenase